MVRQHKLWQACTNEKTRQEPLLPTNTKYGFRPFYGGGSVVVDLLNIVAPIVCEGSVFGPCFVIQYFVPF